MGERQNGIQPHITVLTCSEGNGVMLPDGESEDSLSENTKMVIGLTKKICNTKQSCPPECPFLKITQ